MLRPFHKMHGLGNDFVVIDARALPVDMDETLARALADRQTGVGCDQLIILEPSETADLRMRIWNSDGGEVESCGNATRCVVQLTGATSIETRGGMVGGKSAGHLVEVLLPEPRFAWDEIPLAYPMDTSALPMAWEGLEEPFAVNVGNPHLIFFVSDTEAVDLERLGPIIEQDPAFPERINVNVAAIQGRAIILRTWERGAGLTRACGTGACATAVAAIAARRTNGPIGVAMPGGALTIDWEPGQPILMRGLATHVFDGMIDLDALRP